MTIKFYRVIDRKPEHPELSNNGGDYQEGRTVAVEDGKILGVRFWSSWDGGFCHLCGKYEPFECNCETVPDERDWEGWETGEVLSGWDEELALSRLRNGGYALVQLSIAE